MDDFDSASTVGRGSFDRRGFLTRLASGLLLVTSATAFADELMRTPPLTEGPYYPDRLPLDTDNDLITHVTQPDVQAVLLCGKLPA